MAYQYIYTSAKRGLEPGKSGFCCVARDRDTPPDLLAILESNGQYDHSSALLSPDVYRYSISDTRDSRYHILTRIQDSGIDYSKRNNHIAHHLVFEERELSRIPDPATILLCWNGWKKSWNEPPRVLSSRDSFNIQKLDTSLANADTRMRIPKLAKERGPIQRTIPISTGEERELAIHYRKTLMQLPATLRWEVPFTTYLLSSNELDELAWVGIWKEKSYPFEIEVKERAWIKGKEAKQIETSSETAPPKALSRETAPDVEIPQDLKSLKKRRKRPKLTKNQFNRLVNIALFGFGAICFALAVYLYSYYESTSPAKAVEKTARERQAKLADERNAWNRAVEKANADWQRLSEQAALLDELEMASESADILETARNPTPKHLLAFLEQTRGAPPATGFSDARSIAVPRFLLKIKKGASRLDASAAIYLTDEHSHAGWVLMPSEFWEVCKLLEIERCDLSPLIGKLQNDHFSHENVYTALQETRRSNRDSLLPRHPSGLANIKRFAQSKKEFLDTNGLASLAMPNRIFGLPDSHSFLAFTDDGRVRLDGSPTYAKYLSSLFQDFILPLYGKFEPTNEFRDALKRVSDLSTDSPVEASKSIYQCISKATPTEPEFAAEWKTIVSQWGERFVKRDLMEEAILSFSIDQVIETKKSLLDLQLEFTPKQLRDFYRLDAITASIDRAETIASRSHLSKEWIVIHLQKNHLADQ